MTGQNFVHLCSYCRFEPDATRPRTVAKQTESVGLVMLPNNLTGTAALKKITEAPSFVKFGLQDSWHSLQTTNIFNRFKQLVRTRWHVHCNYMLTFFLPAYFAQSSWTCTLRIVIVTNEGLCLIYSLWCPFCVLRKHLFAVAEWCSLFSGWIPTTSPLLNCWCWGWSCRRVDRNVTVPVQNNPVPNGPIVWLTVMLLVAKYWVKGFYGCERIKNGAVFLSFNLSSSVSLSPTLLSACSPSLVYFIKAKLWTLWRAEERRPLLCSDMAGCIAQWHAALQSRVAPETVNRTDAVPPSTTMWAAIA